MKIADFNSPCGGANLTMINSEVSKMQFKTPTSRENVISISVRVKSIVAKSDERSEWRRQESSDVHGYKAQETNLQFKESACKVGKVGQRKTVLQKPKKKLKYTN